MVKCYRLKCRFCLTEFDWPDEDTKIKSGENLNNIAIVCPGDEKAMIASHVEIVKGGEVLKLEERFWVLKRKN